MRRPVNIGAAAIALTRCSRVLPRAGDDERQFEEGDGFGSQMY